MGVGEVERYREGIYLKMTKCEANNTGTTTTTIIIIIIIIILFNTFTVTGVPCLDMTIVFRRFDLNFHHSQIGLFWFRLKHIQIMYPDGLVNVISLGRRFYTLPAQTFSFAWTK
jgi:hypothetical protein